MRTQLRVYEVVNMHSGHSDSTDLLSLETRRLSESTAKRVLNRYSLAQYEAREQELEEQDEAGLGVGWVEDLLTGL